MSHHTHEPTPGDIDQDIKHGGDPHEGAATWQDGHRSGVPEGLGSAARIAAVDCGCRGRILAELARRYPDAAKLYPELLELISHDGHDDTHE